MGGAAGKFSRMNKRVLFEETDANKDGKLSFDELKAAAVNEQLTDSSEKAISEVLMRFDKDGDGHLNQDEFDKAIQFLSYEPRFITMADFVKCGRIPRCGSKSDFKHSLTGQANENLLKPRSEFEQRETVFVFVSHRWLSPGNAEQGHPDDASNSKYKLLLEFTNQLIFAPNAPIPEGMQPALWIESVMRGLNALRLLAAPSLRPPRCSRPRHSTPPPILHTRRAWVRFND